MQKLMLIGRLGKDPEIVNLDNGSKIAKFSMATSESYKNKQGEKVEETEWFNCVSFGKQADIVEKHFTKGMQVYIEGKLKTRKWEDKDGNTRYNTDVIMQSFTFLSGNKSDNTTSDNSGSYEAPSPVNKEEEDDLPF